MKIRADFVTNSSSSSFTVVQLKSPSLKKWLKENEISMEELEEKLAGEINGDGSGEEGCEKLEDCEGVAEMILELLGEGEEELCEYVEENKEAINKKSSADIYCASQFECDPPRIDFLSINNHGAYLESYGFEELSEEDVEEIEEEYGEPVTDDFWEWTPKLMKMMIKKMSDNEMNMMIQEMSDDETDEDE